MMLPGLNLSHLRLRESVLLNADLSGANLSFCDCERTVFSGAVMRGATLANAILTGVCAAAWLSLLCVACERDLTLDPCLACFQRRGWTAAISRGLC